MHSFYTFLYKQPIFIAAVTKAIDSSIEFPASANAEADLCNASPIPAEVMAKLFKLLLSLIYNINY